jgi:hypothetical protein
VALVASSPLAGEWTLSRKSTFSIKKKKNGSREKKRALILPALCCFAFIKVDLPGSFRSWEVTASVEERT